MVGMVVCDKNRKERWSKTSIDALKRQIKPSNTIKVLILQNHPNRIRIRTLFEFIRDSYVNAI